MPYTTEERNKLGFYKNFQDKLRNEYLERLKISLENNFRDANNVLFSFENIIPDEILKIGLGLETVDVSSDLYMNYIDDKQLDLAKSTIPINVKYPIYDKSSLLEVTIDRKISELSSKEVAEKLPENISEGDVVTNKDPRNSVRYLIQGMQKKQFQNTGTFFGRGYLLSNLKTLKQEQLDAIPDGGLIR